MSTLSKLGHGGRAIVLAICNQKGGVGKTTTTFHLARAAARKGLRVLLIDADPQGNLTSVTAAEDVPEDQAGLADVLSSRTDEQLLDVIVRTVWEGVDLVPTTGETLGVVRDELVVATAGREQRLKEALATVGDRYDLVLIDCPPSLDLLTINGLTAAERVGIVSEAKLFSSNGTSKLLGTISQVRSYYNPALTISGLIVNKYEAGTIAGRQWLAGIQEAAAEHGVPVLDPPIPKRVAIADSEEAAQGLDQWGGSEASELASIYDTHLMTLIGAQA